MSTVIDFVRGYLAAFKTDTNLCRRWEGVRDHPRARTFNLAAARISPSACVNRFLLSGSPQVRHWFAVSIFEEAVNFKSWEAEDIRDLDEKCDWREGVSPLRHIMLFGRSSSDYVAMRSLIYAVVGVSYLLEARWKADPDGTPSNEAMMLLVRAFDAVMLGDAALSWLPWSAELDLARDEALAEAVPDGWDPIEYRQATIDDVWDRLSSKPRVSQSGDATDSEALRRARDSAKARALSEKRRVAGKKGGAKRRENYVQKRESLITHWTEKGRGKMPFAKAGEMFGPACGYEPRVAAQLISDYEKSSGLLSSYNEAKP